MLRIKALLNARDVERPALATLLRAVLAGSLLALAACGGGGGGSSNGGGGGDDDPYDDDNDNPGGGTTVEPTLASIQANVFTPICTQCHAGASAPEGLVLEAGVAYGNLVGVPSEEVPSLLRVDPGNPDDSYIIHKLEGTQESGARMPLGGPYLSDDTIAAIRQWITDGAEETSALQPSNEKTGLVAGWPVADSRLTAAPSRITLIANGELDASTLHKSSVQLLRVGSDDGDMRKALVIDDLNIELSSLAPTVIQLTSPERLLLPGEYVVHVSGGGSTPVLDRAGRIIDGDGDGEPGGDFTLRFSIGDKQ